MTNRVTEVTYGLVLSKEGKPRSVLYLPIPGVDYAKGIRAWLFEQTDFPKDVEVSDPVPILGGAQWPQTINLKVIAEFLKSIHE
jgi:hypothetical protein